MKRMIVAVFVVAFMFSLSVPTIYAQEICNGNFDCDQDVDGGDAALFKEDFGRSPFRDPCPNCPPPAGVPKTGQTTSYATGDDGDLKKGIDWPNPRFTDNEDGTVTDNLTGLIWLKDANCFGQRTWNNALSDANGLASGSCGLTDDSIAGDWRLPNLKELMSVFDIENYSPALPTAHPFINVAVGSLYCSSSTDSSWDIRAHFVYPRTGGSGTISKTDTLVGWPVRNAQ